MTAGKYKCILGISDVLGTGAAGFLLDRFPSSTTINLLKAKMIFHKFGGATASGIIYTVDMCGALCYTHNPSATPCHFFMVSVGGAGAGKCIMGNYNFIGSNSLGNQDYTAYFNESTFMEASALRVVENPQFLPIKLRQRGEITKPCGRHYCMLPMGMSPVWKSSSFFIA